ncbi:cell division protein FtsK [Streptococcus uberis]|uniref:cell division protein FtsK n=1 Tax=Streptococcus uberis TaxID=1349 RepID=UPI000C2D2974|nr:cell division protein FtsK [Streptococcus uberis]
MIRILLKRLRGEPPLISFYEDYRYVNITPWIQKIRLIVLGISAFLFLVGILSTASSMVLALLFWFLAIALIYLQGKYLKRLKMWVEHNFWIDRLLLEMIVTNGLFDERLQNSVWLSYRETQNTLDVIVLKRGDSFSRKVENLDIEIESALGLPLIEKNISPSRVEYSLMKHKPVRKQVTSLPKEDSNLKIEIYGDFVINLRHNYSMLVSGASGAGKSFFTYFWLTRFISQTVNGKHAKLFAIDPKQSDLLKLCRTAGMPTENFGTTNAEAFKIVRSYLKEMERRMVIYDESSAFDSVGIDIGLEPTLLIIEEYSSLVASLDTKEKKDFENMVAIIAQKARSLSMGICIVMQQPRSDSLSTNIREQLVNSVFLGNPSKESAGMMFGTTDLPEVKGKGVGVYSIERGTPKEFESPQFTEDVFEVILPVWEHVAESYRTEIVKEKYFE